jgi:hypothetical protein
VVYDLPIGGLLPDQVPRDGHTARRRPPRGGVRARAALGLRDARGALLGGLAPGTEAGIVCLDLEAVDADLEDTIGQLRRVRTRLRPVAVWRAGAACAVTEPAAWPNPEAQALCRSWDTHTGLKDAVAPPPLSPLYMSRVAARSEGLDFLADRLAGVQPDGDANPNISLALTLATFAALPQWLALPFCAAVPPAPAGTLLLEDRPGRGLEKVEGAVRVGRQLIGGFGLPEGERERLRKQLLCECC